MLFPSYFLPLFKSVVLAATLSRVSTSQFCLSRVLTTVVWVTHQFLRAQAQVQAFYPRGTLGNNTQQAKCHVLSRTNQNDGLLTSTSSLSFLHQRRETLLMTHGNQQRHLRDVGGQPNKTFQAYGQPVILRIF